MMALAGVELETLVLLSVVQATAKRELNKIAKSTEVNKKTA